MVPRSFPGHRDAALQKCSLLAVGGGPTLDYPDATAFLATFERMVEKLR
jgi:hypothetical protein